MAAISLSRWVKASPNQVLAIAVGILVLALAGWTGVRARTVAKALTARRVAWEGTASQLATVRQQFRVPTSTESAALVAESSRMGTLGVPRGDKLTLIDWVGRLAEACALAGVRVSSVARSDSAWVGPREVAGAVITPAGYALSVEFAGSFANAQKFVSSLPPSVSLSRLTAARRNGATVYQLILSVYELDAKPGN
jgi:hypothetical protein